jgi:hypothetical protein
MSLALAGSLSPAALALTHTGGAFIGDGQSVRKFDVGDPRLPIVTEETEALTKSGPFVFSHDALFVASGPLVRRFDRRDLSLPSSQSWLAAKTVLSIADGPERGLVLVLDEASLTLVRFDDGARPVAVWSVPVDSRALGQSAGRLVTRDGSRAFVADASIPGVRLITVDPEQTPATIATYKSTDGAIHDLSLWGSRLALAADSGLVLVNVGAGDEPSLTRLGAYPTETVPARVDANSRFAFIADGQRLSVVDVDPSSPGFMAQALDGWQAPSNIRAIGLDMASRAYVLVDGAYEILDVAAYGGR